MSHDKTKSVTKKKTDFLSAKTCETILSYGCFTFSQSVWMQTLQKYLFYGPH